MAYSMSNSEASSILQISYSLEGLMTGIFPPFFEFTYSLLINNLVSKVVGALQRDKSTINLKKFLYNNINLDWRQYL